MVVVDFSVKMYLLKCIPDHLGFVPGYWRCLFINVHSNSPNESILMMKEILKQCEGCHFRDIIGHK